MLYDPGDRHGIPICAGRCAWPSAKSSDLPPGTNVQGQIVTACRKLGADIVLDTNFGADLVIMEESAELLRGWAEEAADLHLVLSGLDQFRRAALSRNPAAICRPQNRRCSVLASSPRPICRRKWASIQRRIRVIAIMPCTAKKDEAARQQLQFEDMAEIDIVLTTREFARLLRREGIDIGKLEPAEFDNPYMSEFSGAGAIFGTTGGVMEAAVRTMYYVINGKELDKVELEQLRGFEGVRTATVDMGGPIGLVKVAMCHGLKPARQIVEAVLAGKADFDFIEIMACPGGCVDGGGNLRSKKSYMPNALKRRSTLFNIDRQQKVRQSHNNKQIQTLYRDFLEKPYSDKAHHLLHTMYNDRKLTLTRTVKEIWQEITMSTMVY